MKNIRFHITVKGIVVKNKKVLLLKRVRPSSDGLGFWELPGGGLEYKETPDQALTRELKEETGLDIQILHMAYTFTKIREDYQTIGIGYLCCSQDTNVVISDEHTEYQYVNIDHLSQYLDQEIYQDVHQTIVKYIKEVELL